ncbi:hypothetical protein [Brevibacillus laterosporus]|nr:hypothetical protein [Brevibacillus laterosporus]
MFYQALTCGSDLKSDRLQVLFHSQEFGRLIIELQNAKLLTQIREE